MKPQGIGVAERVSEGAEQRAREESGSVRGRAIARLAGKLDILAANDTPADRRERIPSDGFGRLAYQKAKKEAEANAGRANAGRANDELAQSRSARRPYVLGCDATPKAPVRRAGLRRAPGEFGSVPRASGGSGVP